MKSPTYFFPSDFGTYFLGVFGGLYIGPKTPNTYSTAFRWLVFKLSENDIRHALIVKLQYVPQTMLSRPRRGIA